LEALQDLEGFVRAFETLENPGTFFEKS